MKHIEDFLTEGAKGRDIKNIDNDLYQLIIDLLVKFTEGEIDIPQKDNKGLIHDAKILIFDMA